MKLPTLWYLKKWSAISFPAHISVVEEKGKGHLLVKVVTFFGKRDIWEQGCGMVSHKQLPLECSVPCSHWKSLHTNNTEHSKPHSFSCYSSGKTSSWLLKALEQVLQVEACANALGNPGFNTEKGNWCTKRKLVQKKTGCLHYREAMAICLEESSPSSTNSATWRAGEVKTFHLSFKQKSYDSTC